MSGGDSGLSQVGTFIIGAIAFILAALALWILSSVAKRSPKIMRLVEMVKSKIFYNSIARLMIQQYFKLCMLSFTKLYAFSIDTKTEQINSLIGLFLLAFLLWFPIHTHLFLLRNQPNLSSRDYQLSFSSLYLNINTDNRKALMLTSVFLGRRFVLAGTIVFMQGYQVAQLAVMQIQCVCIIHYLIKVAPLAGELLNGLELFNEISLFAVSTIGYGLSDVTPIPYFESKQIDMRSELGWTIIGISALNVCASIGLLLYSVLKLIYPKLQAFIQKQHYRYLERQKQKKYASSPEDMFVESDPNMVVPNISLTRVINQSTMDKPTAFNIQLKKTPAFEVTPSKFFHSQSIFNEDDYNDFDQNNNRINKREESQMMNHDEIIQNFTGKKVQKSWVEELNLPKVNQQAGPKPGEEEVFVSSESVFISSVEDFHKGI
ncbi:hypothetical protein FGO68_gene15719 [Halteria grandinella]|uniref:Uncharacterized protein n=1 Tax=Halteria grandinella TaxID=5974 RepID=A0A8J8NEL0_HALGN|nr:hypothetical protein FGO68_gene15719 [Halteria grandinella]